MVVPRQPFLLIPGCRLFTDVSLCGMLPGSRGVGAPSREVMWVSAAAQAGRLREHWLGPGLW